MTRSLLERAAKAAPAEGYSCKTCGTFHKFTPYVYAHMRDELIHNCDCCEARHSIMNGHAEMVMPGRAAASMVKE
jgi:predicted nucleic acid-binding Zn ribbon protein